MTFGNTYAALTGAALMAATFTVAAPVPADAQVVRIPAAAPSAVLPPQEVFNIVRAAGLDPVAAPLRQGVTYRVRALDRAGRNVSVMVDARFGDILMVEAAGYAPYQRGPYARAPYAAPYGGRPYARDVYVERRIAAMPPDDDEPDDLGRPAAIYPNAAAPAPRAAKPAPRIASVPAEKRLPLPKPRPEARPEPAAAQQPAPPVTTTTAPAATPPAAKPETAPAPDAAPTKWKDEPAPTAAPAVTPKVPDVTPLE